MPWYLHLETYAGALPFPPLLVAYTPTREPTSEKIN